MNVTTSPAFWSTVAALPDHLLLAQTRQLARHEQALQILVLDHLREIEARRLHLTRGYGSLFDYVVHELNYTAAAAWRRIKAMRLCSQTGGARELLQDGSLNLSNAAQLQNLFERSDRGRGRPPGGDGTGGGLGGASRNDGAPGEPAPAAPTPAGGSDPAPGAGPVLDAAAREELVKQAAGKSTREVQQMLAEVDPELAQPSDRMRALGGGRWELKAALDAECRHGLEKLQMLLSHKDPHLTLGGLVARLVRDGLDRYDPARPPRARSTGVRGSDDGAQSVRKPARRDTEPVQRNTARAKGSDVERQSEVEQDASSAAAARGGVPGPSAAKRPLEAEHGSASPATAPNSGGHTALPAKRHGQAEPGRTSRAATRDSGGKPASAPKRYTEAEAGGAESVTRRSAGGRTTSPTKHNGQAELGRTARAVTRDSGGKPASAPKRYTEAEAGSAESVTRRSAGGRTTSPAKHNGQAEPGRTARAVTRDGGGPAASAAKWDTEAECGSAKSAAGRRVGQDEDAHAEEAERLGGSAAPAPKRRREAEHSCGQPKAMQGNGERATSPAERHGRADDDGRGAGVGGVAHRATCTAGHFEAGERSAPRAPVRGRRRFSASPAKRLAYAAGHGAVERSPALERHLAALHGCGALPGCRSRYIPAPVRRDVWRRDQGCCSYVDRESGRRCGSRYRLEIDHIVPFALGGATELSNLRLHCKAHHRLRHAQRHAHRASVPTEPRPAPISAVDSVERGHTVESKDANRRAMA